MWIVRLALNRPYTFVVLSLLIVILSAVAIVTTPVDIFPNINIPVVGVIVNYGGLSPQDMEDRLANVLQRSFTTTVNDIEHMEAQSYHGVSIIKVFFQPGADVFAGMAQISASSASAVRGMPPGTVPPFMIAFSAADVPILQLGLSSKTLSEQQLSDIASNFLRTQLATVQGAELPGAYGGKNRLITVDLDPQKLLQRSISGAEVVTSVNSQNLVQPQGTAKIGAREYDIALNSSAKTVEELNDLPIKVVNGAMVYLRDVAYVHDGASFQTNIARTDGHRGVLQVILKHGQSSTLDVVARVRAALPKIAATLPPDLEMTPLSDQSIFVRAAVNGVLREATIAAGLTAILILLFLGSWRSTLVVSISIPLSILTSLLVMSTLGETINIMTLGGLALAVGILVDDATVEIENINRLLPEGRSLRDTILTGAQQIATPAFVATLSICIVFVPIFFLKGVPGFLFRPLAEAVVFAMLASYFFSRTIVPTLVMFFFLQEKRRNATRAAGRTGFFRRFHLAFEEKFEHLRDRYLQSLRWCMRHRLLFGGGFLMFCCASMAIIPFLGTDLFPTVDAGQIRLHFRAPIGTRVEETASLCDRVEGSIRRQIAPGDLAGISDNIGFPNSGINVTIGNSGVIGTADAEVLISLTPEHRSKPVDYMRAFRQTLPREFPGTEFYFQPADIVSQVLNFGLPAPIDVQLTGNDVARNYDLARSILPKLQAIPGAVDVHIQQGYNQPQLNIDVDRTKAQEVGMTQTVVANNALVSLANSFTTAPNFWVSPQGVTYNIATQTPQYRMDTYAALQGMPVIGGIGAGAGNEPQEQLLNNLASFSREAGPDVASQYNIQHVIDIYASPQDRDLGGVSTDVIRAMKGFESRLPRGTTVDIRGQVDTMNSSFSGLAIGLVFSVLLVYLLMVVNFQSWVDPFIIITALPGALAGIVWILFFTGTTLNVPSLMGAIMCIGVATSNSILLVTFAASEMEKGKNSVEAAASAGFTRLRPVLMTALAMMVGMIPMSLGIGEGAEQNAPLGRAVIGGLLIATVATLFFVPVVYSFIRRKGYIELFAE